MRGDHRALYLGWLVAVQAGKVDDEAPEPRLPAGLGQLDASLEALTDFLRIDRDLVAAAAEGVPDGRTTGLSRDEIRAWVRSLSAEEKDSYLARLIEGEDSHLAAELFQRVARERKCVPAGEAGPRRTAGQIRARAEIITETRKREERNGGHRKRPSRSGRRQKNAENTLQSLAGREGDLWAKVDKLIATRQPGPYDEAVTLLQELRDLADMGGRGV